MAALIVFSGLPGTGKTTIARLLTQKTGAVYLRLDTLEQGLRDLCGTNVGGEGYRLAYRIARDNLLSGNSVIADCCNPIQLTRNEWRQIADLCQVPCVDIEVICSDAEEHRRRVEERVSDIAGLHLPDWTGVQAREFDPWSSAVITVDTGRKSPEECVSDIQAGLQNVCRN